jgi:hypothetical protein
MTLETPALPSHTQVLLFSLRRMRDDLTEILDGTMPDLPEARN